MVKWIVGALVALVVMLCVFLQLDPKVNQTASNLSSSATVLVNQIAIKIEGQVLHPGTYSIKEDGTLEDLVEKAGGLLASADKDAINLDATLKNRDSIYIPKIPGYTDNCILEDTYEKVNLNSASKEELSSIDGISTALAEKIIEYRNTNGDFETIEDIQNVSGIGEKTYEKIRDYLTLK